MCRQAPVRQLRPAVIGSAAAAMELFVRLVRALWVFGVIFVSYLAQLTLVQLLRSDERNPETGRDEERLPNWLWRRRKRVDLRNARRLLRVILRLRGVYIKLGQVLSIMGGFLPRVYTKELEALQDQVPPRPFAELEPTFIQDFGRPASSLYARIEQQPIAAASLGQVHEAWLEDGRKVAVKVLYPGIRDVIKIDMRVLRIAVTVYQWFVPVRNIERVHEALVDLLRRETDYLHEAEMMERMAANFVHRRDILFPEVVDARTTDNVLTMTFMEGLKINRISEMPEHGIDPHAVAVRLVECFYEQLFVHRLFHADSRGVLHFLHCKGDRHRVGSPVGRREISVLLYSALMRAAGLEWHERADVWDRVTLLRPLSPDTARIAGHLRPGPSRALLRLLTVDTSAAGPMVNRSGPLEFAAPWLLAHETAGHDLRKATDDGTLQRGLRDLIAHLVIFHWNRLGITDPTQGVLAKSARDTIVNPARPSDDAGSTGGR